MPLIEITSELDLAAPAPVRIDLPAGVSLPSGDLQLRDEAGDRVLPAQREGDHLFTLAGGMGAGKKQRLQVEARPRPGRVTLRDEGPHRLAIILPEGPFTVYNFDPAVARPFFYPVLAPGGKMVTRS